MTNNEKISLGIAVAAAAGVWFAKRHFGVSGIGRIGDRTFKYYPHKSSTGRAERIFAYEPYFGEDVWVGTIYHDKREICPSHGYFYPHKYGKLMKKLADELGYYFNNN